jgi:hypothetical protein
MHNYKIDLWLGKLLIIEELSYVPYPEQDSNNSPNNEAA